MSFVRIDSEVLHHKKFQRLSDAQFALWVRALLWCSEHWETDGLIPRSVLRELYGHDTPNFSRTIKRLVARGLFDEKEGELYVHEWTEWNQSSDQIRSKKRRLRALD